MEPFSFALVARLQGARRRWCSNVVQRVQEGMRLIFSRHRAVAPLFSITLALVACSAPKAAPDEEGKPSPTTPPAIEIPAACKVATLPQTGLQHGTVRIETPAGEVEIDVELALSDRQRQIGLMCRQHLGDEAGMLFLFDRMRMQSFWMQNTLIPLDMLFIDDTGVIVGQVLNATPLTTSPRRVSLQSKMVLELAAGVVEKRGIAPGQRVTFVNIPGAPSPSAPTPKQP